jgi:hypothetical protein
MEAAIYTPQLKLIRPCGPLIPMPAMEELFGDMPKDTKEFVGKLIGKPLKERVEDLWNLMSGSLANFGSKQLQDSMWGKTAFTAATTIYFGLWTAALDDTFTGATASEATYTSYARLGLTNNTTIFAAGSGTTTYSKTFPSDATKSFATSTGSTSTVTYLGILDGNAGTSADKGYAWCSVTSTTINNGDTPQLAQNAITVTQD